MEESTITVEERLNQLKEKKKQLETEYAQHQESIRNLANLLEHERVLLINHEQNINLFHHNYKVLLLKKFFMKDQ